jgi:hypothetical protein
MYHPLTQVPKIPTKTLYSNEKEVIMNRKNCFHDFLTAVVNHPALVYSPELVDFLKLPDNEFEKIRPVVSADTRK